MSCIIRDKDGNPVQTSRNLRGIRAYVGKHIITTLAIDAVGQGEGLLSILFDNGNSFQTTFASYDVLCDFVRRWRNVYGAPLKINGKDCGKVERCNPLEIVK